MESTPPAFCAAAGGYPLYWYMLSLEKAMVIIWFEAQRYWHRFEFNRGLDGKGVSTRRGIAVTEGCRPSEDAC